MDTVKVDTSQGAAPVKKGIGIFDGVVFVLSCTIGSGMFFAPGDSADAVQDPWLSLVAWLIAGVLSLAGSLVYSELGTSLVSASAESTYLEKAFGRGVSFTFSWTMSTIIGPAACACISWVLAQYFNSIFLFDAEADPSPFFVCLVALCVMIFLCIVNLINPNYILLLNRFNVICKVLAVLVVITGGLVAFAFDFQKQPFIAQPAFRDVQWGELGNAVMYACFALSGWNMLNPLTEEMKNPAKDVPKIYSLGMISTMILALLVNASFYAGLDAKALYKKKLVAPLAKALFGNGAMYHCFRIVLNILICFCCLGSCNGIMMGTSKCIASNGREGVLPGILGVTSKKHQVPYISVLFFTAWTMVLIFICSLDHEKAIRFIVGMYTVGQWGFFILVGISLFALRYKYPNLQRPYKIHLYPVTPAFFVLVAGFIFVMTCIDKKAWLATVIGVAIIGFGAALYIASTIDFFRRIYFKISSYVPDLGQGQTTKSLEMAGSTVEA